MRRSLHHRPILLLGFLLRAGYAAIFYFRNPAWNFFGRGFELNAIAKSISSGGGFASPFWTPTGPTAFLAPGYPLLVAAVFHLFGPTSRASEAVLLSLQVGFAVATIYVLMLLTQRLVSPRAANIAGFLLAITPFSVALPTEFWDTAFSALLLVLAAYLCVSLASSRSAWALAGGYSGLASLVNPSLLPSIACLLALRAFQQKYRGQLALAAIVCCLVLLPWTARNRLVMHAWIPFRTNVGMELWNGNHPGADGRFARSFHPLFNDAEMSDYARQGEIQYMRQRSRLAHVYIASHPLQFVRLSFRRFLDFWTWPLLLPVLAGMLLMKRARHPIGPVAVPLLLFPLPFYFTHADVRFFLVLAPIAYIPCAVLLDTALLYLVEPGPTTATGSAPLESGTQESVAATHNFPSRRV